MDHPPSPDLADETGNISFASTTTTLSNTTTPSSPVLSPGLSQPHRPPSCQVCRRIMQSQFSLPELRFIHRVGSGDIGSVYLVELREGDGCVFAAKVMDKKEMCSRNKDSRARIEREILEVLDHPFLPALYATVESTGWSCLLTEFCPGGDLHAIRQNLPDRRFDDVAVRFYASEVVAALEYLHMMGIIYRDLKPENVLVRSDGHIMLTDFDLSLKDDTTSSTAQIVCQHDTCPPPLHSPSPGRQSNSSTSSCISSNCISPACFHPNRMKKKKKLSASRSSRRHRGTPEIVAEPVDVRSMSFVGTHEYLSPEIVSGEGHGSEVDWWTLGIFVFELFYGTTPFKGYEHESTLANVVARALEFPKEPAVSGAAKDLISQLLVKDPTRRLGSTLGAMAIKHHPFFHGVNWALLRCRKPPFVPRPFNQYRKVVTDVADDVDNSIDYF
ncbi:Serine/threonine-protein kinase D6PKL2 [Linum grandiflorum]